MRQFSLLIVFLLAGFALAACGTPGESQTPPATGPNGAPASTQVLGAPGSDPRVLAWNPNTASLGWYARTGQPAQVAESATVRALAIPCAESPSRTWLAVHLGSDATAPQALYPLGEGSTIALGENNGLACTRRGGIQFSPDERRLGMLRYADNVARGSFVAGTLRILGLPLGAEQHAVDNVADYRLYNDGVLILQFFASVRGEANAADLRWWDGTEERLIEADVKPLEACQFVSGRVERVGDKVYTLFGERCQGTGSSWRLMRSDFAGGNSENIAGQKAGGTYFTTAGTGDLWVLPGGDELLIAYPNGMNLDMANLARVRLADGQVIDVLNGVIVDIHPPTMPRRMVFGPSGDKLIAVTRDGNGGETLYYYDLANREQDAIQLAGGNRSDRIGAVAWGADGTRLFYAITGDANGVYQVSLAGQSERKLIARGTFQGLAVSLDGAIVATSEQNQVASSDVRNHLVEIEVASQRKTVLVEGSKGESALIPLAVR